jgi:hypothetical protein
MKQLLFLAVLYRYMVSKWRFSNIIKICRLYCSLRNVMLHDRALHRLCWLEGRGRAGGNNGHEHGGGTASLGCEM